MAIAHDTESTPPVGYRYIPRAAISLDAIAVLAAALLIYVSGSFLLAEILGVKREAQALLLIPIAIAASYYLVSRPIRLLDPLIGFVILKTATEVILRGQWLYIFDNLATLFVLIVLRSAPPKSFARGAKFVVSLAGILALMGLLQWVLLLSDPQLGDYRLIVSDDGTIENAVKHPIALLGLFGEPQYSFLGQPVARLQSFAKEPSLNVVYFLIPASLAFLLNRRTPFIFGAIILIFSVLSTSGSVYLSLAFTAAWWMFLRVFTFRIVLLYGIPLSLAAYLLAIKYVGLEAMLNGIAYIAQYGDFMSKSISLVDRATGAVANMETVFSAPFGNRELSDIAGPWLVNAALAAGWLGAIFLLLFLSQIGREMERLNADSGAATRFGNLLLLGTMSTVFVFNDYQMSNYAGLVLLAFIHRTIQLRNQMLVHSGSAIEAGTGRQSGWRRRRLVFDVARRRPPI